MRAGKRQHLLTLQAKTLGVADSYGEKSTTWTEIGKEWSSIDPVSMHALAGAKETIMGGAETAMDLVTITMRPRADVTPGCRALKGAIVYDIVAVRPNNRGNELVLIATVGASNG